MLSVAVLLAVATFSIAYRYRKSLDLAYRHPTPFRSRAVNEDARSGTTIVAAPVVGGVVADAPVASAPEVDSTPALLRTRARRCDVQIDDVLKHSRSQLFEDQVISRAFFAGFCGGSYVEIGGLDGVTYSNTHMYHHGLQWHGILIEPSPRSFELLEANRPRDETFNAAVCATDNVYQFIQNARIPAVNGIEEFMMESFKKKYHAELRASDTTRTPIKCRPLSDILYESKTLGGRVHVDLFSLDVEGGELEVLKTVDFSKHQFGVIVYEADGHNRSKDETMKKELEKNGYVFVGSAVNSNFHANKNWKAIYGVDHMDGAGFAALGREVTERIKKRRYQEASSSADARANARAPMGAAAGAKLRSTEVAARTGAAAVAAAAPMSDETPSDVTGPEKPSKSTPDNATKASNATKAANATTLATSTAKSTEVEDGVLTPELVKKHAIDNVVMVTWANDHYYDFVRNWVLNVRKCNVSNFMVGAMDDDLLKKLKDDDVPTFSMRSGLTTADFGWGTENFHKMGRKKIDLIKVFTNMGFDILVSDVDTVWMKNPMPYVMKYPDADVLTSSDHLASTATGDGLEDPLRAQSAANIGIMLIRHTAKELAEEWVNVLDKDAKVWDQNAFNDLMRRGRAAAGGDDKLFLGYDGKLKFGILPVSTFASGHTFFVQRMHEKHDADPYVVHATFQFSGTEGKRHRMREAKLWVDDASYYDPTEGLLAFAPDIPSELMNASCTTRDEACVARHFELVNHQIVQIRNALAIAQKLGRVLVMPPLYCLFDRWWAPHAGTIPGSETLLPVQCPMDHVFEVETWSSDMPPSVAGPGIAFREHSFFENPNVPASVAASTVEVTFVPSCGGGGGGGGGEKCTQAEGEPAPSGVKRVVAPGNATDVEIANLLSNHAGVKVLNFTSTLGAFGRHADAADAKKFSTRVKRYAGLWCCVFDAVPGHIWYDMEFDVVPHTDRHNRVWDTAWEPKTGP